MEDLQKELEEQREMAGNRLSELDRLHQNHREVLQQLEYLKMDVRCLDCSQGCRSWVSFRGFDILQRCF